MCMIKNDTSCWDSLPLLAYHRVLVLKKQLLCHFHISAVHFLAEKLLAEAIPCDVCVPQVWKILSQDKKFFGHFADFFIIETLKNIFSKRAIDV